jgi:putative two-component system response regulator
VYLLETILGGEDLYNITCVGSVSQARERLANGAYAAALIDVGLPGESGIALLEEVHRHHSDTAAIVVTASDDPRLIETAFDTGAYGYVFKPFRVGELLISLASALHRRELERQNRAHVRELEEKVVDRARLLHKTLAPFETEPPVPLQDQELIQRLSLALCVRDEETGAHIRRVGGSSELLFGWAGIAAGRQGQLRLASAMHDVGKIGIPDAILQKPGPLTLDERAVMERHSAIGHRLLAGSSSTILSLGASIALTHHERWDGTGYPAGLRHELIPVEGRVVAIADVFDALTNDRVYRSAFSVGEAEEMMRQQRDQQFDPDLLDIFLAHLDEIVAIRRSDPDPIEVNGEGPA